eukprot:m.7130 g.7130  ORF g.7130 m.7130 type:complete len:255 (+) comp2713_c0_seq1:23-787(+)
MRCALLLLLAALVPASATILGWAECKLCTFVVERALDDINHEACSWVADELTAEAAAVLSETGLAEIVEDPAVWATVDWVCGKLAGLLEHDVHIDPPALCHDVGLCGGGARRRSVHIDPAMLNLTEIDVKILMRTREKVLKGFSTPDAIFPDGTRTRCYRDADTGMYSCFEPSRSTLSSTAPSTGSSSSSDHSTTLTVVASLLGTLALVAVIVCAVLFQKLQAVRNEQYNASAVDELGSSQLREKLIPVGSSDM